MARPLNVELIFQSTGAVPGAAGPVPVRNGNLTIGRGEDNDLTLPDPDQMVSRTHCVIEQKGDLVTVVDLSSNGTFLNYSKSPLGKRDVPLNNGDILSIGRYELVVSITEAEANDPLAGIPPPAADTSAVAGEGEAVDDLLAPLDGAGDEGDFLDSLLSEPADRKSSRNLFPESEEDLLAPLGDEDDPILKAPPADPFQEMGPSFSEPGQEHSDNFSPPSTSRMLIPEDFDDDFLGTDKQAAPTADDAVPRSATEPSAEPPLPEQTIPPAAVTPASEIPERRPQTSAPASDASGDAAQAFLRELGISMAGVPDEELVEVMERLGGVLRAMIVGMRELLMTRAAIKSEFPIDRTMIRATGNNPLKFSVSEDQAIQAMARKTDKGYLDAKTAVEEALRDIRAHEIGMVTGMQAAMKSVLHKLDPALLEERMGTDKTLMSFLGGQKSRYWEAYKAKYGEISDQAEEDFQEFFGKEFARAYLEQMKKI